jgi:hypothetical protein
MEENSNVRKQKKEVYEGLRSHAIGGIAIGLKG